MKLAALLENWRARPVHERLIWLVLSGASALLAFYLLIVQPLMGFHARAARNLDAARTEAVLVREAVEMADRLHAAQAPEPLDGIAELRAAVTGSAASAAVTLSRHEDDGAGMLTLWIDAAEPHRLFTWLADLKSRHGIVVAQADIAAVPGSAHVRAQVLLALP